VAFDTSEVSLVVDYPDPLNDLIAEFQRVLGLDVFALPLAREPGVMQWPDPKTFHELSDWTTTLDDVAVGYPEANRRWILHRAEESVQITVYVSSDVPEHALRRFLLLGAVHEAAGPVFERGPALLGEISAQALETDRQVYIWFRGSAAVEVVATNANIDLSGMVHWLDNAALRSIVPLRPSLQRILNPKESLRVGETVAVEVECDSGTLLEASIENNSLMLVEALAKRFLFLARRSADVRLAVVAVNPATLASDRHDLNLTILP
jgi:hypothetical protein